jgi:hypothetical protein
MKKISEKTDQGGRLEIFEDMEKSLFLAQPHGVINPTLLDEDLKRARAFSDIVRDHWTYLTNTEDVKLVNPFNILYLKEVKKLKRLKQIVVYAPSLMNRMLIYLAAPIIRPDLILKTRVEFDTFVQRVS